jgi:murein L,D-transpeptidase YcbB/YkuD
MRRAMSFSEGFLSGFALAAMIAKDPAAEKARAGLHADVADAWTATARDLAALSKAERRGRVRAFMQPLQPEPAAWPDEAQAPMRALSTLWRTQPASTWPEWLRAAPLPRPGYTPEARLVAVLQRIAQAQGVKARTGESPVAHEPRTREDKAWRG